MTGEMLFSGPEGPLRTLIVGVAAYLALVALLRISGKRTLSKMNAFDLVVTVALGSTLATVLLSRDVPLVEGVAAFVVLILMQLVITASSRRWQRVAHAVRSEPRALLYRGRILHESLRAERVLEEEVQAALRQHGFARYEDVDLLVLETDGTFTAVASLPATDVESTASVLGVPER